MASPDMATATERSSAAPTRPDEFALLEDEPLSEPHPVTRFAGLAGVLAAVLLTLSVALSLDHDRSDSNFDHFVLYGGLAALIVSVLLETPPATPARLREPVHPWVCWLAGLLGAISPVVAGFVLFANFMGRHSAILTMVAFSVVAALILYAASASCGNDRQVWLWFWLGLPIVSFLGDLVGIGLSLVLPEPFRLDLSRGVQLGVYQPGPMTVVALCSFAAVVLGTWLAVGRDRRHRAIR